MTGESVRCPRCGADFTRQVVDGDFAGACPKCLAGLMMSEPAATAGVPLRAGDTLKGFEILAVLGQGGMGVVYKARQSSLGRTVALKLLNPQLAGNPEFVQRFEREAKVLASLNHPNVVHVYDFGRGSDLMAGDFLYLVMEHVDGTTLEEFLKQKPVDLSLFVKQMRDVARGLEAVHGAGLIHRDLKPSNILVAKDGAVKISDFGLAVEGEGAQKLTQTGMFVGSPQYVSPEHAQAKKVDGRSDLYAMGVILFEGAAGRPPFQAPSATALLLKHVNEIPPALYKLAPQTPKSLQELVRRLLAKNPASRPEHAAALGRELDKVQTDLTRVPQKNPERVLSAAPVPQPSKLPLKWLGAGAAAVVLIVLLAVLFSGGKAPAPVARPKPGVQALAEVKTPEPPKEAEPVAVVPPAPAPPEPKPVVPQEPKPANPLEEVWKEAELRFAEARKQFEEGRTLSSADVMTQAGFKAEEAQGKYRALLEVGDADLKKRAGDQIKAVQQFMKLSSEARLLLSKPAAPEPVPPAPLVAPTVQPAVLPLRRGPVPEAAALKDVEKQIREVYKSEFTRKAAADLAAFAKVLRDQAAAEKDSKVLFVLLREAREVALSGGDISGALEASDALTKAFEIEALPAKQGLLGRVPTPKTAEAAATLMGAFEALAREAISEDLYEMAGAAVAKAEPLAKAAQDAAASSRLGDLKKEVAFLKEEYPKAKAALEKPGTGDVEAAGRFLCFCKGEWGLGLAMLASLKSPLGELAARDMTDPSGDAQVAVGDGWWDLAEKEKHPIRKSRLQERARLHYGAAQAGLSGLARIRVEKRLESSEGVSKGPLNLLALIQPERDSVNGRWHLEQGKLVNEQEWFGRIVIPFAPPEEYDWTLRIERRQGDEDFYLGVVRGETAVGISLDAGHSTYTGLGDMTVRGEGLGKFPGGVLPLLKPVTVLVSVRKRALTVSVENRKILTYAWKGDEARTLLPEKWDVPQRAALFVGAHGSLFRVHQMQLLSVSGAGRVLRIGAPAPMAPSPVAPAKDLPLPKGAVDLLALVDPAKDAVEGTWTREGSALASASGEHVRLQFPYVPPDEYDLRVSLVRGDSADGLAFGLARGTNQWTVFVDKLPSEGGHTGLELLDGGMHTAARGMQVLAGQSATFEFRVRRTGVTVLKDGKPLFAWQGATSRLSNFSRWEVPHKQALFVGHWQSAVKYTEVRVIPVTGAGRFLRAPIVEAPVPKNAVDLLALVDPVKDAIKGVWSKDAEGLRCPSGDHIRLMIPYVPPDEYDVVYEIERVEGTDGLLLGLSRGNFQWAATLDSQPGSGYKAGLETLDGGGPAAITGPLFKNGVVSKVEAKVRKNGVTVTVDGRMAIEYKGVSSRLSLPEGWKVGNNKALFLAAWGTSYRFKRILLVPVSGVGAPLRR